MGPVLEQLSVMPIPKVPLPLRPDAVTEQKSDPVSDPAFITSLQVTLKASPEPGFPFGVALGTATNNAHSATVIAILVFIIWYLSSAAYSVTLNPKVRKGGILRFIER
jgi:hypothetical protein